MLTCRGAEVSPDVSKAMVKSAKPSVPPEHAAILRTIAAIPCGRVASYGEIATRGHAVRLMNPRFVRPYVKSNKNDARDAAVYKVA